ncbi:hypothetical protein IV203_035737 [Nitzschia inconspicua]|uniref:Uncharacterized protein n=1 Tax=Nitzschia inconspicua TaxID=303405 RepID=A0A9K3LES9_9STRA|nr:hypothetical protein IV203_035737 [Nitzschia inconspicua]
MNFPATAALEKLILLSPPNQREDTRIHNAVKPSSFNLHDSVMSSLVHNSEDVHSTCENEEELSLPSSPLSFPLIEWSSVARMADHDSTMSSSHRSLALTEASNSSIYSNEDAHFFLNHWLGGQTSDNSSFSTKQQSQSPHTEQTSIFAASSNCDFHDSKRGRLVRSIALGSRLALLDTSLDIVSDKRLCHSMTSSHRRNCTLGSK